MEMYNEVSEQVVSAEKTKSGKQKEKKSNKDTSTSNVKLPCLQLSTIQGSFPVGSEVALKELKQIILGNFVVIYP